MTVIERKYIKARDSGMTFPPKTNTGNAEQSEGIKVKLYIINHLIDFGQLLDESMCTD